MNQQRLFHSFGQYVQHAQAGGPEDWAVLRLLCGSAQRVLRSGLTNPGISDELTVSAHAASEALRGYAPVQGDDWAAAQAVARGVVPVVLRLLEAVEERSGSGPAW